MRGRNSTNRSANASASGRSACDQRVKALAPTPRAADEPSADGELADAGRSSSASFRSQAHPLERCAARPREVGDPRRDRLRRQMAIEELADRRACRQRGEAAQNAHKQPMHVHARMPVEAAVECRMQIARRLHVGRARQNLIELVRIFGRDVRERNRCEPFSGGRVQCARRFHALRGHRCRRCNSRRCRFHFAPPRRELHLRHRSSRQFVF